MQIKSTFWVLGFQEANSNIASRKQNKDEWGVHKPWMDVLKIGLYQFIKFSVFFLISLFSRKEKFSNSNPSFPLFSKLHFIPNFI